MAFQRTLNFGNKLFIECTRQPCWSLQMTISRQSRIMEQKPKTTGNGFLTVNHGNSLMMNHLPVSLLPPSSQTTGHGLIRRWSWGSLLLFPHLWGSSFPMATPSPTCPTLFLHATCFSCPAGPPWALEEGNRQACGTSNSWATSKGCMDVFGSTATTAIWFQA